MKTLCEWGGVARTSRDPPQERKSYILIQDAVRRAYAAIGTWPCGHHFSAARLGTH